MGQNHACECRSAERGSCALPLCRMAKMTTAADPPCSATCTLQSFNRTIAVMLSGKATGGGVAWFGGYTELRQQFQGVLCRWEMHRMYANWPDHGFAYIGNMYGKSNALSDFEWSGDRVRQGAGRRASDGQQGSVALPHPMPPSRAHPALQNANPAGVVWDIYAVMHEIGGRAGWLGGYRVGGRGGGAPGP